MRETGLFFLFLFVCLIGAAVATVPLMQTGWFDYSPQRVMGRLAQLFILIGLWPFLRWRGLATAQSLGWGVARARLARSLALGWVAGVAILLVLVAALLTLGVRVLDPSPERGAAWLATKALQALIAGLLIAVLEETFFRGALYAGIRRRNGLASAVAWSAALYALLHVMKPSGLPDGVAFDWAGAAQMFLQVFGGVLQWSHLDTLAALFLVGVFLALVRERSGHIGWCIGLHAGWVFVIQVTRRLTDDEAGARLAFLVGDYDGVIGWLAAAWIGLLAAVFWRASALPRGARAD
jgi:membrane protease YdiL (CAAX protease family)